MILFDLLDLIDDVASDDERSAPNYSQQSEAEIKAQQAKFASFYHDIISGNGPDNSGPYKLRCIVESDCWWIPVKADGTPELLNVRKGELKRLIAGVSKEGKRNVREGQGGQFVQVYCDKPTTRAVQLNGRELARRLSPSVTGLAIKGVWSSYDNDPLLELGREFFDELRTLADVIELEDVLHADGPINALALRNAKFRVPMYNGYLQRSFIMFGADCAIAATHDDNLHVSDSEWTVETMAGEALFRKVLENGDFDGLEISSSSRNRSEPGKILLSPSFLHRALTGQAPCQYRAKEFQVRSREEFELWLKLAQFPSDYDLIEEQNSEGQITVKATSKSPSESWWKLHESDTSHKAETAESPAFTIAPTSKDAGFGSGESLVLCPGMLARELYKWPPKNNPESKHNWKPGRSLLLGRVLEETDVLEARRRILLSQELLKLIPAGSDEIPRTSILSVLGAAFVRSRPFVLSRAWIEGTIAEATKYSSKWSWGSN